MHQVGGEIISELYLQNTTDFFRRFSERGALLHALWPPQIVPEVVIDGLRLGQR